MSENVKYFIDVDGFKSEDKQEKFIDFSRDFMDGFDYTISPKKDKLFLTYNEGWRSGGATCEELFKRFFGDYFTKNSHLNYELSVIYLDQAPFLSICSRDTEEEKKETLKLKETLKVNFIKCIDKNIYNINDINNYFDELYNINLGLNLNLIRFKHYMLNYGKTKEVII